MPPVEGIETGHPLMHVARALRWWLVLLVLVMVWNAFISNAVLFPGLFRPIPYVVMGAVALYWLLDVWHARRVVVCSSILAVGTTMRGLEVLIFADINTRARLAAASVWALIGATALVFGIMNSVAISRAHTDAARKAAWKGEK